jgi:hypothetical protein
LLSSWGGKLEAGARDDVLPSRLVRRAVKHGKHAVVFAKDFADRCGGEDLQGLQLAQQQESEGLVEIGAGEHDARNWGVPQAAAWMEK